MVVREWLTSVEHLSPPMRHCIISKRPLGCCFHPRQSHLHQGSHIRSAAGHVTAAGVRFLVFLVFLVVLDFVLLSKLFVLRHTPFVIQPAVPPTGLTTPMSRMQLPRELQAAGQALVSDDVQQVGGRCELLISTHTHTHTRSFPPLSLLCACDS